MNTKLIAVAVLATSGVGLAVIDHHGEQRIAVVPITKNAPTPPQNRPETFLTDGYKEYQDVVRKEQANPAKQAQWAAEAKNFDMPSGHCPTEKECE